MTETHCSLNGLDLLRECRHVLLHEGNYVTGSNLIARIDAHLDSAVSQALLMEELMEELVEAFSDRARLVHYMSRLGGGGHEAQWEVCGRERCATGRDLLRRVREAKEGELMKTSNEAPLAAGPVPGGNR